MTVLVGYVPSPEGEAALRAGIDEARLRDEKLLVVNTSRGDAYVDPCFAQEPDLAHVREDLAALGIEFDIRQVLGGHDAAEEIIELPEQPYGRFQGLGRCSLPPGPGQGPEPQGVEVGFGRPEHIAPRPVDEPVLLPGLGQELAERRDVHLQALARGSGWFVLPDRVCQHVDGEQRIGAAQQHGEDQPLLVGAKGDRPAVDVG